MCFNIFNNQEKMYFKFNMKNLIVILNSRMVVITGKIVLSNKF